MKDRLGHTIYCDQCEEKKALFALKSTKYCVDLKDRPLPEGVTLNACGRCMVLLFNKNKKENP
ncbi:hypothetical protein [Endozoicomonas atrinae]|uniref:hypothetical protein n=1 Tax=Endozoicomonas atrinae TaxID=1333660 RepID=UPI003B00ED7D